MFRTQERRVSDRGKLKSRVLGGGIQPPERLSFPHATSHKCRPVPSHSISTLTCLMTLSRMLAEMSRVDRITIPQITVVSPVYTPSIPFLLPLCHEIQLQIPGTERVLSCSLLPRSYEFHIHLPCDISGGTVSSSQAYVSPF